MAAILEPIAPGWYVVIGIDNYGDAGIRGLDNAVSDARAVANLLQTTYGYQELQPPLLNSGATYEDLTRLLERLEQENHPKGA